MPRCPRPALQSVCLPVPPQFPPAPRGFAVKGLQVLTCITQVSIVNEPKPCQQGVNPRQVAWIKPFAGKSINYFVFVCIITVFSPLVAELTGKAVQMVNIISGPHHHLKGRDQFTAGSTIPGGTKEPAKEAQSLEAILIKWWKD